MKVSHIFAVAAIAAATQLGSAQTVLAQTSFVEAADSTSGPDAVILPPKAPHSSAQPWTDRWLDLTNFSHSERYRNQYSDDGYHYFENGQERTVVAGKFKFDAAGKYDIGFRASTGRTFNWSYGDFAGRGFAARLKDPNADSDIADPTQDPVVEAAYLADPVGGKAIQDIQSTGWEFYLRELYFSATPVKHLTLQFGSFGIERGFSTEITTFDDDGYISGERLRIDDPHHFYFDTITLTSAYFGDFYSPSVFDRGGTFSKSNYRQIAGKKQVTARIGISGEYNYLALGTETDTFREAILVGVKEFRILDRVRLEGYERVNNSTLQGDYNAARQGFALVGEKAFHRLSGDFGVASIDRDYGLYSGSSFAQEVGFSMNGDNYNVGIRVFSHMAFKLSPSVTAFGFYTRVTGQQFSNINNQGLNAGITVDLKSLTNTAARVF